jgi:hypothetical protein
MRTVNVHEAKTHFVAPDRQGRKGGGLHHRQIRQPLVKVVAIDARAAGETRRVGFMAGQVCVDFDRMGSEQVEKLFGSDA